MSISERRELQRNFAFGGCVIKEAQGDAERSKESSIEEEGKCDDDDVDGCDGGRWRRKEEGRQTLCQFR